MSLRNKEGEGNVIELDVFRKKRESKEEKTEGEALFDQPEIKKAFELLEHNEKTEGRTRVIQRLEKQGLPIKEALNISEHLLTEKVQGGISPHVLQQWLNNLQKETLEDIIQRVVGLDEGKKQKHPAYTRAVLKIFSKKLREQVKELKGDEG